VSEPLPPELARLEDSLRRAAPAPGAELRASVLSQLSAARSRERGARRTIALATAALVLATASLVLCRRPARSFELGSPASSAETGLERTLATQLDLELAQVRRMLLAQRAGAAPLPLAPAAGSLSHGG
jgi:hypothetical protein